MRRKPRTAVGRRLRLRGRPRTRRLRGRPHRGPHATSGRWPNCIAGSGRGDVPRGSGRYVTAGGSAYFDVVAEVLAELAGGRTKVVVRVRRIHHPRRRLLHRDLTVRPQRRQAGASSHVGDAHAGPGWCPAPSRASPCSTPASATSRSTKDSPPRSRRRPARGDAAAPRRHRSDRRQRPARVPPARSARPEHDLRVGDVVRLGLSHPCTAFDKWRWIPVVGDDSDDPVVVDLVRTFF